MYVYICICIYIYISKTKNRCPKTQDTASVYTHIHKNEELISRVNISDSKNWMRKKKKTMPSTVKYCMRVMVITPVFLTVTISPSMVV